MRFLRSRSCTTEDLVDPTDLLTDRLTHVALSMNTGQQFINRTAEAMGIGPNIMYEFKTASDLVQGFGEVMESDVDAVFVMGEMEHFLDAVSIFDEVESGAGGKGGLFRIFRPFIGGKRNGKSFLEILRQAELVRQASGWLVWPNFYHPNMRHGEETGKQLSKAEL